LSHTHDCDCDRCQGNRPDDYEEPVCEDEDTPMMCVDDLVCGRRYRDCKGTEWYVFRPFCVYARCLRNMDTQKEYYGRSFVIPVVGKMYVQLEEV